MEETRATWVWVRFPGLGRIEAQIPIPADCFSSSGELIKEDAIEYVERWMTDDLKMEYGCCETREEIPEVSPGEHYFGISTST